MDDVRVGRFIRVSRLRLGWRQVDLAVRAGVSQQEISVLERGHLDAAALRTVRRVLRLLDASIDLDVRWRGGAIDRLLDARHTALVSASVDLLEAAGWQTRVEVTYSEYGERGSIDVLGWRPGDAVLVVGEVKSDLTSVEQTQRKHDEKVRLAPRIVRAREGWSVRSVGRLLILPETRTARRQVDRAGAGLARTYPMRQREVRAWLRHPSGPMGGILFVPDTSRRGASPGVDSRSGSGRSPEGRVRARSASPTSRTST